jgi:ABC-type bacteriocin/lantibiotic exporter with double-glycine peptidase domain
LYVLARLSGAQVEYEDVRRELSVKDRRNSLVDLRDASQRFGLRTVIYKWDPQELAHFGKPVIAYMEGLQGTSGSFVTVLKLFETKCHLIDGNATFIEMPIDDFRRYWTGYVLAPHSSWIKSVQSNSWCVSLAIGVLGIVGYASWRTRGFSRSSTSSISSQ